MNRGKYSDGITVNKRTLILAILTIIQLVSLIIYNVFSLPVWISWILFLLCIWPIILGLGTLIGIPFLLLFILIFTDEGNVPITFHPKQWWYERQVRKELRKIEKEKKKISKRVCNTAEEKLQKKVDLQRLKRAEKDITKALRID